MCEEGVLDQQHGSQKATLVVLVVVVISSLKITVASLVRLIFRDF